MDDDAFWAAVDAVEESPDSEEEEDEFWSRDAEIARADADAALARRQSAAVLPIVVHFEK
eukprot:gene32233-40797_t